MRPSRGSRRATLDSPPRIPGRTAATLATRRAGAELPPRAPVLAARADARLAPAYAGPPGSPPCNAPSRSGAAAAGACFSRARPALSQRPSPAAATMRAGSRIQPIIDRPQTRAALPAAIATMPATPNRLAAASAICPKAPTMRPIKLYVAMRPRLKSSRRPQRAAGVAPLGMNWAVHIATYGPHMATQWALPSSDAANSSTRSPPTGSSGWWCTVLRPDLVFALFNVAKLPGAHGPQEHAPCRHRHEKGAEEHIKCYVH